MLADCFAAPVEPVRILRETDVFSVRHSDGRTIEVRVDRTPNAVKMLHGMAELIAAARWQVSAEELYAHYLRTEKSVVVREGGAS